ncbi:hypothetical protein GCM10010517_44480 [Streptosporangium fragile]|uniref:Uncharacterized protein n=1 Tax=Streptosporangium fragile TaxID=46186 RepID=A0ABP6IGS8_9ACTN
MTGLIVPGGTDRDRRVILAGTRCPCHVTAIEEGSDAIGQFVLGGRES